MPKKLVEWDDILHIHEELWALRMLVSGNAYDRVSGLLDFFEENVVQFEKEELNDMKRDAYLRMKNATTPESKQRWYDFYQELKATGEDR